MPVTYGNEATIDWMSDKLAQTLTGFDWNQLSQWGTITVRLVSDSLPGVSSICLPPELQGTTARVEWHAYSLANANAFEVRLMIVDIPPGILPGGATEKVDSAFIIPVSHLRHIEILGDDTIIEC